MQRGRTVLTRGIDRKSALKHAANYACFVVASGVRRLTAVRVDELRGNVRILHPKRWYRRLVLSPACVDQFDRRRTTMQKRTQCVPMSVFACYLMGGHIPSHSPLVNRPARFLIDHRKIFVAYPHANAVWF